VKTAVIDAAFGVAGSTAAALIGLNKFFAVILGLALWIGVPTIIHFMRRRRMG
jgi:hypothetical protein